MILLSFDSTLYREDTWIALAALWKYFNFHGYISQYCTSSDMSLRNHSNLNISVKSINDKHLRINSRVPVYLEKIMKICHIFILTEDIKSPLLEYKDQGELIQFLYVGGQQY